MKTLQKYVAVAAVFAAACGTEAPQTETLAINEDAIVSPINGAHAAHTQHYTCGECHNTLGEVTIKSPSTGYAANPNIPAPSYNATTKTCSNVQCHTTFGTYNWQAYDWGADDGSFIDLSVQYANAGTPNWYEPMGCNGCHGPGGSPFTWHGWHNATPLCQNCHPTVTQNPTTKVVTFNDPKFNPTADNLYPVKHFNGVVELAPKYKASCFNCH